MSKQPSDFQSISAAAKDATDQNRLDEAIPLYRKALALRPSWVEGWWSLGTILYDKNDYAGARRAFQKLVALQPKAGSPRVMLGLCEFELGLDAEALKNIEQGRALGTNPDPQFQQVMVYHQGLLLLRAGRFPRAKEVLSELAVRNASSDDVFRALGKAALLIRPQEQPADGSPLQEAISAVGHAEWLAAQKNFDGARSEYEALAARFASLPHVFYAYGRFLEERNDTDGAIAQFEREIHNNPSSVFPWLEIAELRYRSDSAAGIPYAEQAVKLAPERPLPHYVLGLLLLDTDNVSRAIPELEIARKGLPSAPEIYFALGNAYARAGRKEDAALARATFTKLNEEKEKKKVDAESESGRLPSPQEAQSGGTPKQPQR